LLGQRKRGTIILFGSFAKGRAPKESDVDLFIVSEEETSVHINAVREIEGLTDRKTNEAEFLKRFARGDPLMREVVSNHVILKGIDSFVNMMWRIHVRP
jgi:predicted nucleotidyltransferase